MQKVKLAEIIRPRREKVIPSDRPDLPFIGMEHVEAHTMKLLGTVPAGTMRSAANRFYPGDVLYGRLRPYLNKVYKSACDGLCSAEFIVLPKTEGIHPDFLRYRLNAQDFVSFASQLNAGDRPRVDFEQISSFEIFLPSYLAQRRIVAEIEKQFSRLDEAVANLKRVKANLKRYKAAVLKAAVEGKLTEEWRTTHVGAGLKPALTEPIETGAELLERILAERRKAAGKGKYKEPVGPDTSGLPELPEGWVWASVEQISSVVRGASPRPAGDPRYFGGDVPWITVGPITADADPFLRNVPETLTVAGKERSRFIEPHTLLLTNSGATLGVPKISLIGGCINDGVAALLNVEYPTKIYLLYFLRTLTERLRGINQGAAQPNLNTAIIKDITVPLPPLLEQERIVAGVERHLSIIAEAEAQVDANLRRADRLRQSILKQAFSGQLVPQDPNDEPASVLLERIRANANVGARRAAVPASKPERPKRAQHAVPLRETKTAPAASDDFTSLDSVLAAILNRMQPGREYSRAEIADPLGLSTGRWNAAIQELKRRGKVRQVGERRGTTYSKLS